MVNFCNYHIKLHSSSKGDAVAILKKLHQLLAILSPQVKPLARHSAHKFLSQIQTLAGPLLQANLLLTLQLSRSLSIQFTVMLYADLSLNSHLRRANQVDH
jgi:hypothetical protein